MAGNIVKEPENMHLRRSLALLEAREGFHIVSLGTELSRLLQVSERTPVKIPEEVLKLVA